MAATRTKVGILVGGGPAPGINGVIVELGYDAANEGVTKDNFETVTV